MLNESVERLPICNLEDRALSPEPAVFVVFGATGDLAHRKIFPALYDLFAGGLLPEGLAIVGFARRPYADEAFRDEVKTSCAAFARRGSFSDKGWKRFAERIFYLRSDLDDPEGYRRLASVMAGTDEAMNAALGGRRLPSNALFYLAVGPAYFGSIAERLREAGLGTAEGAGPGEGWRRLVVEKPYGHDGASAKALTATLQGAFAEKDIYRIDHYLGKETVQNLLYLRFANAVFEPVWNRNHIESIDISVYETEGIGERGGYYDAAGAARDMMQNHLVQLMCLTTMEPPASLDPESIRDEKVKVLRSIDAYSPEEFLRRARRGQYARGSDGAGGTRRAYREESRVGPGSTTETFASLRLELDNWRFSGVPITLSTGKAFAERFSQIVIRFRRPPAALFAARCGDALASNELTIRIQPDEGVWLRFNAKVPGLAAIKPSELRFSYRQVADYLPEAYERLIADALAGDSTLFIRADESEYAWRVLDGLEKAWASADPEDSPERGGLILYPAGSPVPMSGALEAAAPRAAAASAATSATADPTAGA
ncbi:glucose-6-phosphate dehydrogenase [bacterium]|nr:glucose-6-phosphate dehydrogenase [bacterium]